ncbi:MAG TPA: ABC transporter permease subunit, partial [Dermatophilaceae bacterium]|nr:ABC transporter permease subunit [Dermatophilaceae bacterium]
MTRDRAGRIAATTVAAILPLGFLAIFFALPVAGMLARGFAPGGVLDLGGFAEVLGRARTQRIIGFTLAISAAATVISVVVGVPVAHALYRLALPGRRTLRAIVAMPFVLPTVVVGVMFRSLLAEGGALGGLGLDGEWGGILAAFVFFNLAVVVRTVGAAWEGLDRRPEEAAATLGAGPATVFRTVTLPALAPSIISAASIVFLFCATAFGVVLTMGGLAYGTVETEIYLLTTALFDLRGAAVLSVVQLVAVVAMLLLADRARSRDAGTQRAAKSAIAPGRVTAYAMGSVIATVLAVAFVAVPVLALVVRSLRRQGEWTLDYYLALGRVGGADGRSALPVTVWEALGTSWRIAIDATILAVVLGLLVAVLVSRPARSPGGMRWRRLLDGVVMLPLGVSAVTVGFGFLITLDRPPLDLRTSPVLIPIAQAIVALPLVVRTLAPVLRAIDDRQRQVAATLGARPWQVLATVDLPIIWRPLLAAVGLALAVSLGEFGATSFLARPDSPTLPVVIYRLIG